MFTSATDRTAFGYVAATALTALFGGGYEIFSHGVWSGWMVYAFAFPLALGALPFGWMALKRRILPCRWWCQLHHAGVATLTAGSLVQGVLSIYGTTNRLTSVYWVIGGLLMLCSLVISIVRRK